MNEEKKERILTFVRLTTGLALGLIGLFWLNEDRFGVWVNFAIMAVAWLIVGYDVLWKAFRSLIHEKNPFDENMLMTLASVGAFCLRLFGRDEKEWFGNSFFEAFMVVFLYQLGDVFEDLATDKSHKAITDAVGLRAKTATLLQDGIEKDVDPSSLKIGDIVRVKVGEIIPADGIVVNGEGDVDLSSLTGEFDPVPKREGALVNSGTVLKTGSLTIQVNKSYEDSTVSKILKMVEESSETKSKADRFITKFSHFYTPCVLGIALLTMAVPPLFLGINLPDVWKQWIRISIELMVISCPCAIVVSVPLAYFAGIGLASKHGIVVKGATYFDALNHLGVLVTDKTGTLTEGHFVVEEWHPEGDVPRFQEYLIAAESRSNHPIAKAIVAGQNTSALATKTSHYSEKAGYGEILDYDGHHLLAGNRRLLEEAGVSAPLLNVLGTIVLLAVDGKYAGYVLLNDKIKPEAKEVMTALHQMGVHTVMLTGDKKENALRVGEELGIDEVKAELLPDQKAAALKTYLGKGKTVAYVGDGINDAPSIRMADVGFAMGGMGSDMAIENADVVIMQDDLSRIVTSVKIAKATKHRAIFDIVASLCIKVVIALCAFLIPNFPLIIAVFADTGTTLLMVAASVLLLGKKIR